MKIHIKRREFKGGTTTQCNTYAGLKENKAVFICKYKTFANAYEQ